MEIGELASDRHVALRPSFEDFYRLHREDLVRTLAVAVGGVDLAEDAVDVAMSRLWRRWDDIDDPAPWTYRVARNWATSWWRRRKHHSTSPVPELAMHDEDSVTAAHDQAQLTAALDSLSQDHRDVIALRIVAEYSVADTAIALDIPEGTVKSRTARALDELRRTMEVAS